jgi:hypothetical protein
LTVDSFGVALELPANDEEVWVDLDVEEHDPRVFRVRLEH